MTATLNMPVEVANRTALPAAPSPLGTIVGLGIANPPNSYTQREVLDYFDVQDRKVESVFLKGAIERRSLVLPPKTSGVPVTESQGELLQKHRRESLNMGEAAILNCLSQTEYKPSDIGYLCVVTTTGFLTPGLSALLIERMGLRPNTSRLDVVGMGCNAGLNGLNPVANWTRANPGKLAILLCVESCSSAYVFDGTMRTSVVNSLFGDGAAAAAVVATDGMSEHKTPEPGGLQVRPKLMTFNSRVITEAVSAMRYDWDDEAGKFSFYLDRDVPYVVGANAECVVDGLLEEYGLRRSAIQHWIVHSGGKKVIDSVMVNVGLTRHDVRHTTSVLRDYGNLSSGSFLFSLHRLLAEGKVQEGDWGLLMTMGPGSTIETALVSY